MLMRQLEYFVAVARERHFGRAADTCYISRSALTTAINKLERELDVTLIDRDQNFRSLTPEGRRLLSCAKQVLADRDRLTTSAAALRSGSTDTLHLGVGPTIPASTAAGFVAKFYRSHPLASVQIRSRATPVELLRDLHHGQFDAVIGRFDDDNGNTSLAIMPLYEDPYVLIAPNRLILGASSMSWTEISELPLALLNCDTRTRQIIDEAFSRSRSAPDPRIETDSVAALFAYVATGEWASVVPRSWLPSMPTTHTSVVEIVEPHASELVSIAIRTDDQSSVGARFLGLIVDRAMTA